MTSGVQVLELGDQGPVTCHRRNVIRYCTNIYIRECNTKSIYKNIACNRMQVTAENEQWDYAIMMVSFKGP